MAILPPLGLVITGLVLYCHFLGYPSGPVFREVRAPKTAVDKEGRVILFLSGDMGFNTGMGPRIAEELARRGFSVVGVNSLTAFSYGGSADEASRLVETGIDRAFSLPNARKLVVIGQSFGANILLAAANRLPSAYRNRISAAAFIVPADTMMFRATPGGIIDLGDDGPALPYAKAMRWLPMICIHGRTEEHSLCPIWDQGNVRRFTLPGGHFLNEDVGLVVDTLEKAVIEPMARDSVALHRIHPG